MDTVSLHVHERVDPATILAQATRRLKGKDAASQWRQPDLFAAPFENLPLRQALEFYRHEKGWSNRLVAGDSLLVMNSLITKESMGGCVQMIYIDPPYGIKYGSNFQPFVNKRDVKDRSDDDLTQEPETIKAFRDTWELGIHSYLTYLRDRLLLARELLSESGSVFVQIGDANVHRVRAVMDEILGEENFVSQISYKTKKMALGTSYLGTVNDYIIWYAKSRDLMKFRRLFFKRDASRDSSQYQLISYPDGFTRRLKAEEKSSEELIDNNARLLRTLDLHSSGRTISCVFKFKLNGEICSPSRGKSWKTNQSGTEHLIKASRLVKFGRSPEYKGNAGKRRSGLRKRLGW